MIWQAKGFLSGKECIDFDKIVKQYGKDELIKNLEDWSDLLSGHHNRFILERELQKLGITL